MLVVIVKLSLNNHLKSVQSPVSQYFHHAASCVSRSRPPSNHPPNYVTELALSFPILY